MPRFGKWRERLLAGRSRVLRGLSASTLFVAVVLLAATGPVAADGETVFNVRIINQDSSSWTTWYSPPDPNNPFVAVAAGDWDGNGLIDTAYSFTASGTYYLKVIAPSGSEIGSRTVPYPVRYAAMGDGNTDGKWEIMYVRSCNGGAGECAYVWHYGLTPWLVFQSNERMMVAMGDWNHDGKADTAYTLLIGGTRYIKVDDPSGSNLMSWTAETRPIWSLAMGDVNSDVYDELMYSTQTFPSEAWIINHDLTSAKLKSSTNYLMAVAIGNWDNVGKKDTAYSWSAGSIHYALIVNPSGGTLLQKTMCSVAYEMAFGNFTGDSRQELLYSDLDYSCPT